MKQTVKYTAKCRGSRSDPTLAFLFALVLFFNCTGTGKTIMHALPNTEACVDCGEWMSKDSPGCDCSGTKSESNE